MVDKLKEKLQKGLEEKQKKLAEKQLPEKQYFNVVIQGTIPVTLEYRVFAEDEEAAFKIVERNINNSLVKPPKLDFFRLKKALVNVKSSLTGMITWNKRF